MADNQLQVLINTLFSMYHSTFPEAMQIPVSVSFTDDLNRTHAELRPDRADLILKEGIQSDYNGRMVVPESLDDPIHILLNTRKVEEYTNDGSMTWIGTIGHEYTHAIDFYQMARLEELDSYSPLEETSKYVMFQQWTEYHARKCGYRFLRKYFEATGQILQGDEQIEYIMETEAPIQTRRFNRKYNQGSPNDRLYLTMQYLGRFSVWIDLFPAHFNEEQLLDYCPGAYWMMDLLQFLRKYESLNEIYGHFDELQDVLSENWTF